MTPVQMIDVAMIFHRLQTTYGIDINPVAGAMEVADYQFILKGIERGASALLIARTLAAQIRAQEEDAK
jgi:hypothetical protein